MKATFALLPDRDTLNAVSKTAWDLHQRFRLGLSVRRLPPHVSLKQPFDIEDMAALEWYMSELARGIAPMPIELLSYDLWEYPSAEPTSGVLSIKVRKTPLLRDIHTRLNRELTEQFGERRADYDGDPYSFHLTVAGGVASVDAYRAAFAACKDESVARTFTARELAMFVYENDEGRSEWQYLTYKTLPLGKS